MRSMVLHQSTRLFDHDLEIGDCQVVHATPSIPRLILQLLAISPQWLSLVECILFPLSRPRIDRLITSQSSFPLGWVVGNAVRMVTTLFNAHCYSSRRSDGHQSPRRIFPNAIVQRCVLGATFSNQPKSQKGRDMIGAPSARKLSLTSPPVSSAPHDAVGHQVRLSSV